jgi:hypothetical protein
VARRQGSGRPLDDGLARLIFREELAVDAVLAVRLIFLTDFAPRVIVSPDFTWLVNPFFEPPQSWTTT